MSKGIPISKETQKVIARIVSPDIIESAKIKEEHFQTKLKLFFDVSPFLLH